MANVETRWGVSLPSCVKQNSGKTVILKHRIFFQWIYRASAELRHATLSRLIGKRVSTNYSLHVTNVIDATNVINEFFL